MDMQVRIPKELHQRLKVHAAQTGQSVKTVLVCFVEAGLPLQAPAGDSIKRARSKR